MVLESLIQSKKIVKHFGFIFLLCFLYVFVGYSVAFFFFENYLSVITIFTLALLLTPSIAKIITQEEKIESRYGLAHFFRHNRLVFHAYFAAFFGVFLGYIVLGSMTAYGDTLSFQKNYLEKSEGISKEAIDGFLQYRHNPSLAEFLALFSQNLAVMLICFALSIFYGAGAIFLVILNSSVAATLLIYLFRSINYLFYQNVVLTGIFMIHWIPEIAGFIMSAIAGAVFSQVMLSEKYAGRRFKNVMKNVFLLFLIAVLLIFVSAFLELVVSDKLVSIFLR